MLDPWIIEEINRRERERRDRELHQQPELLPPPPPPSPHRDPVDESDRGVVTIEICPPPDQEAA